MNDCLLYGRPDLIMKLNTRDKVCYQASKSGYIDVLEWIHINYDILFSRLNVYHGAMKGEQFHVLKWVKKRYGQWGCDICDEAAENNYTTALIWLMENGEKCQRSAYIKAARNGHLDLLQTIKQYDKYIPYGAICKGAAEGGHINILEWISHDDFYIPIKAAIIAHKNKQEDAFHWIVRYSINDILDNEYDDKRDEEKYDEICRIAAREGNLYMLKCMRKMMHNMEDLGLGEFALENRNTEIITWLIRKCICDAKEIYAHAAEIGYLEPIEREIMQGSPHEETITKHAILGEQLEVLWTIKISYNFHWLNKNGCTFAAENKKLKALEYLTENRMYWKKDTFYWATRYGYFDLVHTGYVWGGFRRREAKGVHNGLVAFINDIKDMSRCPEVHGFSTEYAEKEIRELRNLVADTYKYWGKT
jgi:hypothetical protein